MKKNLVLLSMVLLVCCFSACKKSTKPFVGEYTYQTDGRLTLTLDSEYNVPWTNLGQLQALKDKDKKASLILVYKSLLGDISTQNASVDGDVITCDEYVITRNVDFQINDTLNVKGTAKIHVNSTGRLYDNTIIFDEDYSGLFYETNSSMIGTIKGDDIKTIAKLNN
ncbi:MAG: hypothetical protein HUK15_00700 [Bacteroidales bacterium]|nr:hypothetical protein [Bacteroidales bacterium]